MCNGKFWRANAAVTAGGTETREKVTVQETSTRTQIKIYVARLWEGGGLTKLLLDSELKRGGHVS